MELPAVLEQRAVEIARTTDATPDEARNILGDGFRLLGLEQTTEHLERGGLDLLAVAVCVFPMTLPKDFKLPSKPSLVTTPHVD